MAKGEGELLGQPLRPSDLLGFVADGAATATTSTSTSAPKPAPDATPSPTALPPLVTQSERNAPPSIALPPLPSLPAMLPVPRREVLLAPAPTSSPLPPLRFNSLLGKQPLRPAVPGPLNAILDASLQDPHTHPLPGHPSPVDGLQQAAVQLALLAEFNRSAYSTGCDIKRESALTIMKPKLVKPRRKRKPRVPDNLYCRSCGSTETPEWRRGPDGEKSLCNACGLHFAKILRREQMARPTTAEPAPNKTSISFLLN